MAWQQKQIWSVGNYRRLAKLPDAEYRALLHEVTGCSSSKDPRISNRDYGMFMARLEAILQYRVDEGFVPAPWSAKLAKTYWRDRLGGDDMRRLMHKIYELWAELKTTLPREHRTDEYLRSIASSVLRGMRVEKMTHLETWQRCHLIEALKLRIFQNRKSASDLCAGLPGSPPVPEHISDPIVPMIHEDEMSDPNIPDRIIPALDTVPF